MDLREPAHEAPRLLFVDDEPATLAMYRKILAPEEEGRNGEMGRLAGKVYDRGRTEPRKGYEVVTCLQGDEAVRKVKDAVSEDRPFAAAFVDIRMPPGPDGVWTAEQIRREDPFVEIVIISGFSDTPAAEIAVRIQPRHKLLYMQKPFHVPELVQLAAAMSAKWESENESYRLHLDLDRQVAERTREYEAANAALESTLRDLRTLFDGIVKVLTGMVELRDPYTAGHQARTADLARSMGVEMGLAPERLEGMRVAGIVHDIGKIAIPAEILSKPGKLNGNEYALIKSHPQVGYDLLKTIDFPWPVADIVYEHHERMDGTGYPRGLSGGDILLEARILAIADVVEAMSSHRPYRPALGVEKALAEITSRKGTHYDAEAVDACLTVFHDRGYMLK